MGLVDEEVGYNMQDTFPDMPVAVVDELNGHSDQVSRKVVLDHEAEGLKHSLSDDHFGISQLNDKLLHKAHKLQFSQVNHVQHEKLGQHVEACQGDLEVDIVYQWHEELYEATREEIGIM